MSVDHCRIAASGDGFAARLAPLSVEAAGTRVLVVVEPGHIAIETDAEPTLDAMLDAFDPERHSGEVMAFAPVGVEVV